MVSYHRNGFLHTLVRFFRPELGFCLHLNGFPVDEAMNAVFLDDFFGRSYEKLFV